MADRTISRRVEIIQTSIGAQGDGIDALEDWIDFLEQVCDYCDTCIDGAREDIKRRDERRAQA